MPYLNMDDNFPDHPKIDPLSDGAYRLHTAGMFYAAKHLTDGLVPTDRVPRLTRTYKPVFLAELLKAGLWKETRKGYEIHDYLDWNRSREWWESKRAAQAERKRKWRESRQQDEDQEDPWAG